MRGALWSPQTKTGSQPLLPKSIIIGETFIPITPIGDDHTKFINKFIVDWNRRKLEKIKLSPSLCLVLATCRQSDNVSHIQCQSLSLKLDKRGGTQYCYVLFWAGRLTIMHSAKAFGWNLTLFSWRNSVLCALVGTLAIFHITGGFWLQV